MKEWREYMSESDGSWLILKETGEHETSEDKFSKNGQEAIHYKICEPSEQVSVNILPASRITDDVKKTVSHDKCFYLQIHCMKDGWSIISGSTFTADEALKMGKRFLGLPKDKAIKIWEMRGLGGGVTG